MIKMTDSTLVWTRIDVFDYYCPSDESEPRKIGIQKAELVGKGADYEIMFITGESQSCIWSSLDKKLAMAMYQKLKKLFGDSPKKD